MHCATITSRNRLRSGRTIHLLDVENLHGGGHLTPGHVRDVIEELRGHITIRTGDHIIIGVDQGSAIAVHLGCAAARIVTGRGPDGADRAILEVVNAENVAARFERVTIGSGDGIFTTVAASLAMHSDVTVVARDGSLSNRLRMAAGRVVLLPRNSGHSMPSVFIGA